jgi:hypothetical protein
MVLLLFVAVSAFCFVANETVCFTSSSAGASLRLRGAIVPGAALTGAVGGRGAMVVCVERRLPSRRHWIRAAKLIVSLGVQFEY